MSNSDRECAGAAQLIERAEAARENTYGQAFATRLSDVLQSKASSKLPIQLFVSCLCCMFGAGVSMEK